MTAPKPLSRMVAARSELNGVGLRARILAVAGESFVACGGSAVSGKDTDLRRVVVGAGSGSEIADGNAVGDVVEGEPLGIFISTSSMVEGHGDEREECCAGSSC